MIRFKTRLLILTYMGMILSLSACIKPHQKSDAQLQEDNSATFYVNEVTGTSKVGETSKDWKTPLSRLYNFTACINDMHTQDSVKGHKFIVVADGTAGQNVRTDSNGCLNWSESIAFNFMAKARYLPLKRIIRADGAHSGQRILSIGIDPWTNGGAEVIDLLRHKVPADQLVAEKDIKASLDGTIDGETSMSRPLWVDDLSVQNTVNPGAIDGADMTVNLDLTPKVLLKDREGKNSPWTFPEGKFRAVATFVAVNRERNVEKRSLLGTTTQIQEQGITNGKFRVELPMHAKLRATTGQLEMALRLIPVDGPSNLTDFEGVFLVGSYRALIGSASPPLRPISYNSDNKFSLNDYLKNLDIPDPNNPPSGFSRLVAFEFDLAKVKFLKTLRGETTTDRGASFSVTTCVSNPTDAETKMRDVKFMVTHLDGKVTDETTQPSGCLVITDVLWYKYYELAHPFVRYFTIKHSSGFTQKIGLSLNPWETYSELFGLDVRDAQADRDEATLDANQRARDKTRIIVNSFDYATTGINYEIDSALQLHEKKTMTFTIQPMILRYSLTKGRFFPENLKDGVYLFKAAIYLEYPDIANPSKKVEHISTIKRLAKVENGFIREPLEFDYDDLHLMRIRNNILFEIAPVDETKLKPNALNYRGATQDGELDDLIDRTSGLEPRTFIGPMQPYFNGLRAPLRPTDDLTETNCNIIDCKFFEEDSKKAGFPDASLDPTTYFANVKGLSFLTVTKLIRRQKLVEEKKKQELMKLASLTGFVKQSNTEFISLDNEDAVYKGSPDLGSNNRLIPKKGGAAYFLSRLNDSRDRWYRPTFSLPYLAARNDYVSHDSLRMLLSAKTLSQPFAERLCQFWMLDMIKGVSGKPGIIGNLASTVEQCLREVKKSPSSVFVLDQKLRVLELGKYTRARGARYSTFSVGANFNVGYSEGQSEGTSWFLTPFSVGLNYLPPAANLFGFPATVGSSAQYNINIGLSNERSISKGSNFGQSVSLGAEQLPMNMTISKYEPCSIIRLNPGFIVNQNIVGRLNNSIPVRNKLSILTRGITICSGHVVSKPYDVREYFYYFTPELGDMSTLDPGDPDSYPWAISLRGTTDFENFITMLRASKTTDYVAHYPLFEYINSFLPHSLQFDQKSSRLDVDPKSLDHLQNAVDGVTMTTPGIYTIPPTQNH